MPRRAGAKGQAALVRPALEHGVGGCGRNGDHGGGGRGHVRGDRSDFKAKYRDALRAGGRRNLSLPAGADNIGDEFCSGEADAYSLACFLFLPAQNWVVFAVVEQMLLLWLVSCSCPLDHQGRPALSRGTSSYFVPKYFK